MNNNLPKKSLSFIFYFVRQSRLKFTLLALASVVWAANDALFPYFLKRIVNTVQTYHGEPAGIYAATRSILLLLALMWGSAEICMRGQGILQIYTFPRFRTQIRDATFNYVTSHSHAYFSNNFAGNIGKKLSNLPTSCQTVMESICFNFLTAGAGALIVLVMMWFTQSFFAVILLAWLCIHLGVSFLFLRHGNYLWEAHSEAVSTLSGKVIDTFSNMLNVRLFARGEFEAKYLGKFQEDEMAKSKKAMWLIEIMRLALGINGLFLIFGMIFTLLYGWVHHWITLGDFTQVIMQAFWLLGWIWYVSFQMTIFAREIGTINEALGLIKKNHDLIDKPDARPIVIRQGNIEFKKVGFAYQENRSVFENLNIHISAGEKVGLVGFSGSGKSTFVNLILRFYDLASGHILIDHQDVSQITQESLRDQIAMIPQDPSLFHRSLMENIRYGRLEASDSEVITASKLAHCHEFITQLKDGYDSLVGERGLKLSGGQRQRIAIARAILKNAPILILDEATSSLDSVTEKIIQESLDTLMAGKTTIIVAHRLSTLANMDRILVFHKGKIVEEGKQRDLLKKQGHFAALWNMQANGFLPDEDTA